MATLKQLWGGHKNGNVAVKPSGLCRNSLFCPQAFSRPYSPPRCWLLSFDTADVWLYPPSCWTRAGTGSSNGHPSGFSSRITWRPRSKGNTREERGDYMTVLVPSYRGLSLGWLPSSSSLVGWLTILFCVSTPHSLRFLFQRPRTLDFNYPSIFLISPLSLIHTWSWALWE